MSAGNARGSAEARRPFLDRRGRCFYYYTRHERKSRNNGGGRVKKFLICAVTAALAWSLAGGAANAADAAMQKLKIKNKDWQEGELFLKEGRLYGPAEVLARGGSWEISREGGACFVSVPSAEDGSLAKIPLPLEKDGLADLTFFGSQAGLKYKLNEKKKEIKFEEVKKPDPKKDRKKAEKKKKEKKQEKKSAEKNRPIFAVWDPDSEYAPGRPFFSSDAGDRVLIPGWSTSEEIRQGTRSYSIRYIEGARKEGIRVMPRISNDFDPDGTSAFLRDSGKKEEFLRRLASYTAVYGLDGWNMDFECMNPKDAPLYTELVAGAAERMHAMNKELSVDIMPIGAADSYWTGCYDRKGLAEHADYEILMGYDQTGGSSPHAGPNAACDWLERILPPLLKEVPAEKLVLGMPLYTRVWTGDDGAVRSDILTVRYTDEFSRKHKIVPRWQKKERQFYADWREGGVRRRAWLEESRSLGEKLGLLDAYGLRGAAFWRYGFETPSLYGELEKSPKK